MSTTIKNDNLFLFINKNDMYCFLSELPNTGNTDKMHTKNKALLNYPND